MSRRDAGGSWAWADVLPSVLVLAGLMLGTVIVLAVSWDKTCEEPLDVFLGVVLALLIFEVVVGTVFRRKPRGSRFLDDDRGDLEDDSLDGRLGREEHTPRPSPLDMRPMDSDVTGATEIAVDQISADVSAFPTSPTVGVRGHSMGTSVTGASTLYCASQRLQQRTFGREDVSAPGCFTKILSSALL